jgi:branched-chain amino acid transport system ATP-binding protein
MLTLNKLSKSFGKLQAVDNVSLTVPQGQIAGLIGPNGSGKSTLLSTVAGTLEADSGEIHFDDQEITHESTDQRFQRGLVRSFQDPSLFFRMGVLDNALLPARDQLGEQPGRAPWHRRWRPQEDQNARRAELILQQLSLDHQIHALASDLSGGQMKLLELGRSLMGNPRLLLLDEPTAGVAPALAYKIFEQIDRLRSEQGLTFLIVEHRLEILFDYVDSVSVMHLGQIIAHGTPAEIQETPQVREVYFGE